MKIHMLMGGLSLLFLTLESRNQVTLRDLFWNASSKWVKNKDIRRGDEINIFEQGEDIILTLEKKEQFQKILIPGRVGPLKSPQIPEAMIPLSFRAVTSRMRR